MRIIIFGDSISEGYNDYEKAGWVNRLKADYMKNYLYDRMVMNYGISAYTSDNICNSFESFFSAVSRRELGKEKQSIVIFAFGVNDSAENRISGNKRVDIEKFVNNIEWLINTCQSEELIKKVFFLGNINIEESIINSSVDGEHYFYNTEIQKYNSIIQGYSLKNKCGYVDMFGIMNPGDLEDGLHPNSQGHEKIYQKVKEYLEEKL